MMGETENGKGWQTGGREKRVGSNGWSERQTAFRQPQSCQACQLTARR